MSKMSKDIFWVFYRFNSVVGIEMIDDVSLMEYRFDFIVLIGKFGNIRVWFVKI